MAKFKDHMYTLDYTISGIPCQLAVLSCLIVPPHHGSAHTCNSDLDYYGYEDVEYEVLDRKGYIAEWLSNKMSDGDDTKAVAYIVECAKQKQEDDYFAYYDRYD